MIPVQFITHHTERISYEESAMLALKGGCRWIQLRIKEGTDDEVAPMARRIKAACAEQNATFIIDDRVELVKRIEADGVHLGKKDMPVQQARNVLGEGFLIGGTANTVDDLRQLKAASADYAGCGPFRFTTTKKGLAPIIGLEGYRDIMRTVDAEGIDLPVCAIGGITFEDIAPILSTGIHGIAVSGAILRAADPVAEMHRFLHALDEQED